MHSAERGSLSGFVIFASAPLERAGSRSQFDSFSYNADIMLRQWVTCKRGLLLDVAGI